MNEINQLNVEQKRLSTAEASLWVYAHVESVDETTQLRGSLVGPRCAKIETVQIAYSLKSIKVPGFEENVLVGKIIIPEPNLWSVEKPFVYEGNVELWQDGKLADIKPIRAMFKTS